MSALSSAPTAADFARVLRSLTPLFVSEDPQALLAVSVETVDFGTVTRAEFPRLLELVEESERKAAQRAQEAAQASFDRWAQCQHAAAVCAALVDPYAEHLALPSLEELEAQDELLYGAEARLRDLDGR